MSEPTAGEVLYRLSKRLEGALSDFEQHPSGAWSIRESPDFNAIAVALVTARYSDIPALATALTAPAPASAQAELDALRAQVKEIDSHLSRSKRLDGYKSLEAKAAGAVFWLTMDAIDIERLTALKSDAAMSPSAHKMK